MMFVIHSAFLLLAVPAFAQSNLRKCELALDELRPVINASLVMEKNTVPSYPIPGSEGLRAAAVNLPQSDEKFTNLLQSRAKQKIVINSEDTAQVSEDDLREVIEYRRTPPQSPAPSVKKEWTRESIEEALKRARPQFDEGDCIAELFAADEMDLRTLSRLKPDLLNRIRQDRDKALRCHRITQEATKFSGAGRNPQIDCENFLLNTYFPMKLVQRAERDQQILSRRTRQFTRATAAQILTASEIDLLREFVNGKVDPVVKRYLADREPVELLHELQRRHESLQETSRKHREAIRLLTEALKARIEKTPEERRESDELVEGQRRYLSLAADNAREQAKAGYVRILKADCLPISNFSEYPRAPKYSFPTGSLWGDELKVTVQEWQDSLGTGEMTGTRRQEAGSASSTKQ